jgi:hypothetical protein
VRSPGRQEGARTGGVWFPLLAPCVFFPSDQPPQLVRDALPPANRPVGELSLLSRAPRLLLVLALVLGTFSACTRLPVGWTGRQAGLASWYGPGFYGRHTASGTVYTGARLTAAHRSLPFGTLVRVTNLENGRRVVVVIDDRGPSSAAASSISRWPRRKGSAWSGTGWFRCGSRSFAGRMGPKSEEQPAWQAAE